MIYESKIEEEIPKDSTDYRKLFELIENLRDGNLNPKEVLKNQVKFKLDLNEIKLGGNKSEDQKNIIRNVIISFFEFTRKKYSAFQRLFSFAIWS